MTDMRKLMAALLLVPAAGAFAQQDVPVRTGDYQPDWESLSQWECPEWFKDAKFGIWAHWGPQCQAEAGDWYGRFMYFPGSRQYEYHVRNFGEPSEYGLKELCRDWKAENWQPDSLVRFYKEVGARYFFTLGQHHDNFDLWDSPYQEWNSVNIGPHKDIVKGWSDACRKYGLPLGISMHGSHTWTWLEKAQEFDGNLTRADGAGQWWEGYDPQELYAQCHEPSLNYSIDSGIHSQWDWDNGASTPSDAFKQKFQNRVLQCIDEFHPAMLYFDDTVLPFYGCDEQIGLNILAHYYNTDPEVVPMGKKLDAGHKRALLWDVERGVPDRPQEDYWQTCTCIGSWHYDRGIYERGRYKPAAQVIDMLVDIVSKNGNLLLSVPVRADGTIDDKEVAILMEIKAWLDQNGESIYGTRPWKNFGEGPLAEADIPLNSQGFNEKNNYSAADVRYVQRDGKVYATILRWPEGGSYTLKSLGSDSQFYSGEVSGVRLLGHGDVEYTQQPSGLVVTIPSTPCNTIAPVFEITFEQPTVLTLPEEIAPAESMWIRYSADIDLPEDVEDVRLAIAADSKYWLTVNDTLRIREGQLKRGPNPRDTYRDILSSETGLRKGRNHVDVLVWHFGKSGFSHNNSGTPGMSFSLDVNGSEVATDSLWRVALHPAFYVPEGETPNYRLPESNIGYDARRGEAETEWMSPRILSLDEAGWGVLVERPVPQWRDYGLKGYRDVVYGDGEVTGYLPYNAQVTPYIKLVAPEGSVVDIRTDDYMGGSVPNVRAELIAGADTTEFECYGWMNGHNVIYTLPDSCTVIEVGYRETGYDTDFAGSFSCDNEFLNLLWDKSLRTLYITMRDTYMDCPDRERAQWWGDVVNELGETFYSLDENSHMLTRKAIRELIAWQRADSTIFSPVPGNYEHELPMQMLASVGHYGFWTYYMGTGDSATIATVYPGVKRYMHVWQLNDEGLVTPRRGGWTWGDWGRDKDMELLFNQWYIIALDGLAEMATLVGDEEEASWATETADSMRVKFHEKYWNGEYYVSPGYTDCPDDRAQALAVVSRTAPEWTYPQLRSFFAEHRHASPYMEKYVLQALCEMGCHEDAISRMELRYNDMVNSPLTTLWEGWGIGSRGYGGGSYNHAWSGGPLIIMSRYLAGIEPFEPAFSRFTFCPNPAGLSEIDCRVPLKGGRAIEVGISNEPDVCTAQLIVPEGTEASVILPAGFTSVFVNGTEVIPGTVLAPGSHTVAYTR